jgi:DNA-binding response OmpR family regulator
MCRSPNFVLLVEDDARLGPLVKRVLTSAGFSVRAAVDAEEAMQLLQDEEGDVEVALVDLNLPGAMKGKALAQHIKAHCPAARVIVMSGNTFPDFDVPRGEDFEYLNKPFLPSELLAILGKP